jgi:hypothetical protein
VRQWQSAIRCSRTSKPALDLAFLEKLSSTIPDRKRNRSGQ